MKIHNLFDNGLNEVLCIYLSFLMSPRMGNKSRENINVRMLTTQSVPYITLTISTHVIFEALLHHTRNTHICFKLNRINYSCSNKGIIIIVRMGLENIVI